ncbi:hypothetical protein TNCV_3118191 [Trichonephila clavipes]|uniref:Uncharacterized protein n=1 Tax=Trichonephila clavipes TaxID=2585209 RepID=A0A8X6WA36_TRICX|nr:hypothetical protein TNCV_3118191 [Trichonephila clavipes]
MFRNKCIGWHGKQHWENGKDAQFAVFTIWRSETPKMKLREEKQLTIYDPLGLPSRIVISFRQYANRNPNRRRFRSGLLGLRRTSTSLIFQLLVFFFENTCHGWLAQSSSENSQSCHSKPSSMNGLEAMKIRQVITENASSLHGWIKCFECILHISYRLDIKKWSVDAPKPVFETTNDGNTAGAFFWNPVMASAITKIDEILIRKLLTTKASDMRLTHRKV